MGCEHRQRSDTGVAEGATVRLDAGAAPERRHCGGRFPFWTLWMIWPAIWLFKGLAALSAPLLGALAHPMALSVSPLALLLVAAGVALLLAGRARRER
jgi:hypothetical protein